MGRESALKKAIRARVREKTARLNLINESQAERRQSLDKLDQEGKLIEQQIAADEELLKLESDIRKGASGAVEPTVESELDQASTTKGI
jgi:hypothetical protein